MIPAASSHSTFVLVRVAYLYFFRRTQIRLAHHACESTLYPITERQLLIRTKRRQRRLDDMLSNADPQPNDASGSDAVVRL